MQHGFHWSVWSMVYKFIFFCNWHVNFNEVFMHGWKILITTTSWPVKPPQSYIRRGEYSFYVKKNIPSNTFVPLASVTNPLIAFEIQMPPAIFAKTIFSGPLSKHGTVTDSTSRTEKYSYNSASNTLGELSVSHSPLEIMLRFRGITHGISCVTEPVGSDVRPELANWTFTILKLPNNFPSSSTTRCLLLRKLLCFHYPLIPYIHNKTSNVLSFHVFQTYTQFWSNRIPSKRRGN